MKNLIRKAIFLAALTVFPAMLCLAQTKVTVTGIVLDNEGEPLIGVSVIESGTSNGVATGLDGTFSIMTNEGASLDFSYVGFEPQTLKPGRNRDLRVIMTSENDLDAVVVVGYGTIDKRSLTNSVSKISDEEFISGTSSPLMAVQGKIPGLSIISTNGADPNSGVSLQLRGINSVNGDQGPLVVIDGVPGAELELVAKEDIESITVLKDASAAAIAASAFLELTDYVPDGKKYLEAAERILKSLSSPEYLAEAGANCNFVLKHCVGSIPHGSEIDVPLIYADYYYLEALLRYVRR